MILLLCLAQLYGLLGFEPRVFCTLNKHSSNRVASPACWRTFFSDTEKSSLSTVAVRFSSLGQIYRQIPKRLNHLTSFLRKAVGAWTLPGNMAMPVSPQLALKAFLWQGRQRQSPAGVGPEKELPKPFPSASPGRAGLVPRAWAGLLNLLPAGRCNWKLNLYRCLRGQRLS